MQLELESLLKVIMMFNIKFKSDIEKFRFQSELGKSNTDLSKEDLKIYYEKYLNFKNSYFIMKNFSINSLNWVDDRYSIINVPSWSIDIKGKAFVKNILPLIKWYLNLETFFSPVDVLGGLSSLKTNLYIEYYESYRPFLDRFEFEYFLTYAIDSINLLERTILLGDLENISAEQVELLIRVLGQTPDFEGVDFTVSSSTGILKQLREQL